MPTRRCTTLLLALAALAAPARGGSGADAVVPSEAFARIRPGVSSSGPPGMRRSDPFVEPAAFHSLGLSAPLPPPKRLVDDAQRAVEESQRSELKLAAPTTPPQEIAAQPAPPSPAEPAALDPAPQAATAPAPIGTDELAPPAAPLQVASRPEDSSGRLLGASSTAPKASDGPRSSLPASPFDAIMEWRPSSQQMTATGAGLAITVGLLLSFMWLIRSMAPKSSRALPREVVEVLGRAPLAGKQTTQLVRVGHKLVLIAVTPDGAETLTEITDPDEVSRLVAACDASGGRGSTAEFDALLRQMEGERTRPGFLGGHDDRSSETSYGFADDSFDPRSLAAAYANTPGGRGDG